MYRVYGQQRLRDVSRRCDGPGRLHDAPRLASAYPSFASRSFRRVLGNAGLYVVRDRLARYITEAHSPVHKSTGESGAFLIYALKKTSEARKSASQS